MMFAVIRFRVLVTCFHCSPLKWAMAVYQVGPVSFIRSFSNGQCRLPARMASV